MSASDAFFKQPILNSPYELPDRHWQLSTYGTAPYMQADEQYMKEVRGVDGITCWLVDGGYSNESFFVRNIYFDKAESSYDSLKQALKAVVDTEAWERLYSAVGRPFEWPGTGRIARKTVNHLGDGVMKVVACRASRRL